MVAKRLRQKLLSHAEAQQKILAIRLHPSVRDWVYVEGSDPFVIEAFCKTDPKVIKSQVVTPIDPADAFIILSGHEGWKPQKGDWARVKKAGIYSKDIGLIIDTKRALATICYIPRVDLNYGDKNGKRKRPQKLQPTIFPLETACAIFGGKAVLSQFEDCFIFKGDSYISGFCCKTFRADIFERSQPPEQVIKMFVGTVKPGRDKPAILTALDADPVVEYQVGESVEFNHGAQKGLWGKVTSIDNLGCLSIELKPLTRSGEEVPISHLDINIRDSDVQRCFTVGDSIEVCRGMEKDKHGMVLKITNTHLTFIETGTHNDVSLIFFSDSCFLISVR